MDGFSVPYFRQCKLKIFEKNRHKDVAEQQGENFAGAKFSSGIRKSTDGFSVPKTEKIFALQKKLRPDVEPRSSGANECERKNER